jgi:hypothetical protein
MDRPDLIPSIRARLAAEWGCRVTDLNITSITDRIVSETVVDIPVPCVPRWER